MRGACCSSICWLSTLAVGSGAPSGPRMSANAGIVPAMASMAKALTTMRMRARYVVTVTSSRRAFCHRSDRDILVVTGRPTPGPGAVATLLDPRLVDFGDDLSVARQQRFGGAHLGAQRQLARAKAV